MQSITLRTVEQEARADSRSIAQALGNQHENVLSLLNDYSDEFGQFGILRFETGESVGRGRPPRYALLNEDQCYLLLTMVRNTERVVPLKVELVRAFSTARRGEPAPAPLLPTDPIELLELSLQGIQQNRRDVRALQQTTAAIEDRLNRAPISHYPEQEAMIYSLCQELGAVMPGGWRAAYRAFKAHFGHAGVPLAKYTSLPTYRFDEACGWLRGLIAEHNRGRLLGGRGA